MYVLVVDHHYEDAEGQVRSRRFLTQAVDEPRAMTCSKVAFMAWIAEAIVKRSTTRPLLN